MEFKKDGGSGFGGFPGEVLNPQFEEVQIQLESFGFWVTKNFSVQEPIDEFFWEATFQEPSQRESRNVIFRFA